MSKIIKIEAGQEPAIQNAIDDAEGRARQRTVSAAEVIRHAAAVDRRLASIHRSSWGSSGALNRECLSDQEK